MRFLVIIFIIVSCLFSDDFSIDELLENYYQKSDLSEQTKKESAGHLTIITNNEIEKMRLSTLKDLFTYLPFISYGENKQGVIEPFYSDSQPPKENLIRVYLNNVELYLPYGADAMKIFGNVYIKNIDHIEIYLGIPSYSFGIETSVITIRLYTKDPKREDVNTIGLEVSNKGSSHLYGLSAKDFGDFSYLLNVSNSKTNRSDVEHKGLSLSRDNENFSVFSRFKYKNHYFNFFGTKAKHDNFQGTSLTFNTLNAKDDMALYHFGYLYQPDDENYKIALNYTNSKTDSFEQSADLLAVVPISIPPYFKFIQRRSYELKQEVLNLELIKKFEYKDSNLLLGYRGRLKKFDIQNQKYNDIPNIALKRKRQDFISIAYAEATHMINEKNMLTASLKYDFIDRGNGVKNDDLWMSKIGYIYSDEHFRFKTFGFVGDFPNQYYDFIFTSLNEVASSRANPAVPENEKIKGITAEFGYKNDKHDILLTLGYVLYYKKNFFNEFAEYLPFEDRLKMMLASIKYSYNINLINKFDFNIWVRSATLKKIKVINSDPQYGGYVRLLNSYKKFDFSNSLVFNFGSFSKNHYFNLNSAITYNYSRNLKFYIKANNILNKAFTQNYKAFVTQEYKPGEFTFTQIDTLNNTKLYDREFMLGLEYSF